MRFTSFSTLVRGDSPAPSLCARHYATLASGLLLVACADPKYNRGPAVENEAGVQAESGEMSKDSGAASVEDAAPAEGADAAAARDSSPGAKPTPSSQLTELADGAAPPVVVGQPVPEPDAGKAVESFPAWGDKLLGTYASLSHVFVVDELTLGFTITAMSRVDELSIVRVVREGEGARMYIKMCRFSGESEYDVQRMVDARGVPEISRRVKFIEGGGFTTDAEPLGLGYDRAIPELCRGKPGQQVPKQPWQAWLAETCRCPRAESDSPRRDDCRLLDPDGDQQPGMTFVDRGRGIYANILDATLQAVVLRRSHPVLGVIDAEGNHFANFAVDELAYGLCDQVASCDELGTETRPCEAKENSIHYVRLQGDGWDCDKLLAAEPKFPATPARPGACAPGVLTDDPTRGQ